MNTSQRTVNVPRLTTAALVLSVFSVSVGYGVVLPLLPDLVARLLEASASPALVSRHTGLLTAVYALALFVAAPAWGRLSDSQGRRTAMLAGLLGFGTATVVFSLVESIPGIYVQRFLSGLFAAAATPVASATIGDLTAAGEQRGRRLAFVSMASVAGFLIGPSLGVFLTRLGAKFLVTSEAGSISIPLASTAIFAGLVSAAVAFAVPNKARTDPSGSAPVLPAPKSPPVITKLLVLTFVVSTGIGVFEVGLALRGTQELHLTKYQIALMFTECSLVMFVAQAVAFSPWIGVETTRRFITPSLVALATGLLFVPWATSLRVMLGVIGVVAASAGVLSPILTYWVSMTAGSAQGWELGKQTAAASLGVTIGSAAGGLLFNIGGLAGASFILAAGLVAAGVFFSLGLLRAPVTGGATHQGITKETP